MINLICAGNIGRDDGQLDRNPMVSARPSLPNTSRLHAERSRVMINLLGAFHMGNPG